MISKSIIGTLTKKLNMFKQVFNNITFKLFFHSLITVSFLLVMFWLRNVSSAFAFYMKRILEVVLITFVY